MKFDTRSLKHTVSHHLISGCILAVSAIAPQAFGLEVEQKPLLVAEPLPPNIMFILDDSGSMRFGFMPDSLVPNRYLGSCTGRGNYAGASSTCFLNIGSRAALVSPDFNKIYYNPDVTYRPPFDKNGNRFPDSNFFSARVDGFSQGSCTASSCIDLSNNYRAIMDDYYYYGSSGEYYRYGFTISPYGDAGGAFYFKFKAGCSDPSNINCYEMVDISASERTNFANWFSYYRNRLLLSKSGVSDAFNTLDEDYRLGYFSINKTGGSDFKSVLPFSASRSSFYDWIRNLSAGSGTPLRSALKKAGDYFSIDHPYQINPTNSSEGTLSCRQNFAILMTDGYWSGDSPSGIGNADNEAGDVITGPGGITYQYSPVDPFKDNQYPSLADVAMYYWKNDLRSGLNNDVPASNFNPAFWQHMVTIGIGLGVVGNIDKDEAFAAINTQTSMPWDATTNAGKIDDLLHAAVNSRGNFFSAQNPQEFVDGLIGSLADIVSRIGANSALAANSFELLQGSTVYNAGYRSGDWSGSLTAFNIDPATGGIASTKWTANFPTPSNRKVFTNKVQGSNLQAERLTAASDLDSNMESALMDAVSVSNNADYIVSYLLGDRSREQSQTNGIFRNRPNGILGDVVHSSPVFVGAPSEDLYKYTDWPESSSHATFAADNSSRTPAIYVGANDGMVHAFSDTNGTELFAFMPRAAVMNGVGAIADPDYDHRYFMDGNLIVQDVYMQPNWKTVLVGTTGRAGSNTNDSTGKAIFALDVTNPGSFDQNDVMWEISHNAIGQITSKPVIAKLDDGYWYAILGNGYNSALGKPALIKIRLSNGDMTVIEVTGNTGGGLAGPLVWDSNGDGTFDTAYAGDLEGRVWSFNLNTNASPSIVYQAKDGSGNAQPITAPPTGSVDSNKKTWIFFGTGQYLTQADMSNRDVQTWYGIRPDETDENTTRAALKERTITEQADISGFTGRNVSAAETGDMTGRLGWFMDLVVGNNPMGERIVNPLTIRGDVLLASTLIPIADACNPGGDGFSMAVDPFTGARLSRIYFDFNNDGQFDSQDLLNGVNPSGLSVGRIPSAAIFVGDNLYFNTDSGLQERIATNPGTGAGETDRLSWREVVN